MEPIELDVANGTKRFVPLRHAPDPSDIVWENTRDYGWGIVRRRVLSRCIFLLLLSIALVCQVVIGWLAEDERKKRIEEYAAKLKEDGRNLVRICVPVCLLFGIISGPSTTAA
jgi:hypothetical protein